MSNGGTVEEIEAEINILHAARRAHEACRDHARTLIADAERAAALARDAELYARREMEQQQALVDEYDSEIDLLLGEYQALIPQQRTGE